MAVAVSMLGVLPGCEMPRYDDDQQTSATPLVALPTQFAIKRFASWDAMQAHLGATVAEPEGYTRTHLSAQEIRPNAVVIEAIYVTPGDYAYYDIVTSGFWPDGPPDRRERDTIAGQDGWVLSQNNGRTEFAFSCASTVAGPVWCVIKALDEEIESFIQALPAD